MNSKLKPLSIDALMDADGEDEKCAALLSGGLVYGLRIAKLLVPRLKRSPIGVFRVLISAHGGHADGLFFHDEARGRAVRVTVHQSASGVNLFMGTSDDFEFPSRLPKEGRLESIYFEEDEIPEYIDMIAAHFADANISNN